MDTLDKASRLVEALSSKKDADKTAIFKKIVNLFVSTTSWSSVAKELSTLNKKEVTADNFKLTDDEFSDLNKKTNKTKDSNFTLSVFQKSISKQISLMLIELEKYDKLNSFEDVVLPLLVLAVGLPLKYHTENDPFGTQLNYGANDSFNKKKTLIYAPLSYKALSLTHSSSNDIIRPIIIPILQFIIKCDEYITLKRLHDVPFIVQCLRFAVHYEDSDLEVLRSSFWELAIKVIKSVDFDMTSESTAIFDQLNALIWNDNGEDCTKAVWRSSNPSEGKSLIMSKEEVCVYMALLRGMHRRVLVNVHLKSCLRDVIKALMKSISYRKSSQDCMDLLKLLKGWIHKGKESPFDVSLVRMMIRDVLDAYDSYLGKSPNESMESTTKSLLSLGQETLAVINNLKSVKSSLESLFDRVNITISKSGKDTKDLLLDYVKFFTESIDFCDDSVETKDTPWFILFRAVFVRCFVVKMKVEWMEKSNVLNPLYKTMSGLLNTVGEDLKKNMSCDYMNECIPILTEVVYLLISGKMENEKKWKCIMSLSDSHILSTIIKSISMMKNQSAKNQCSSFISKMVEPLTEIINTHHPKTTLSQFESFFTIALTVDISTEIRETVCTLWKNWYGCRMEELSGVSITDELMGRLKWFNLPIPPNTINAAFEVKLEGGSPKKSVITCSTLKKGSIFSSPAPIKKAKNANDALKIIDLMDEDSVQFYPVESPKKKQRMTEKQKEMMMEKKDRLPFMEDESTTGIQKIPSDIFEMSMSCADGSKSSGSKKGQMKTDFSDLIIGKKSDEKEEKKDLKKTEKDNEKEKVEVKKEKVQNKIKDDNIEESASSDSMMEEDERKGNRRKTKTPVKMNIKTREERSPSRKKLEAALSMNSPLTNSPRRKSKRLGKIEENEKMDEEKIKKKQGKKERKEEEKKEEKVTKEHENNEEKEGDKTDKKNETSEKKEEEVKTTDEKCDEDVKEDDGEGSSMVLSVKEEITNDETTKILTPKRDEKITITSPDHSLICLDDSLPIRHSIIEDSSPIKSMDGEMDIPSTPANRGSFEPVGILSSSKKKRSEKKKGGVHFNLTDDVKVEIIEEEEGEKKEDRGIEDKTEKMVFAPLRDNEDSIDTIILKLGLNSRMIKKSLEMIGVKTIGQLASLTSKEINGIMGIKPPKMLTVQKELKVILARSEKPSSQSLPPICTPEKKKENAIVSTDRNNIGETVFSSKMDTSLPLIDLSPVTSHTSPPKSKSRKRLALCDSPIRVKKMKEDEDEKKEEVEKEKKEENTKESMEIEMIEEKKEEVDDVVNENQIEVAQEESDVIAKKDEKDDEVMEMNEDNKENEEKDNKKEMEKEAETEMDKPAIASVQDVVSFISSLKGGSLQSFLEAHEQITLSLMDALRDVRNTHNSS